MKRVIEDYLKTIYDLHATEGKVSTTALAQRLKIAPASVTGMLKKLARMNLVQYERYQGVRLTPAGEQIALEVIRHHRLIELFLAQALNVPWDRVHEEAEKWEHVLSEDMEDRIDQWLGSPKTDPHGSPIPDKNGKIEEPPKVRLSEVNPSSQAVVAEVSDHDPELLRYLGKLNIYPQTRLIILEIEPFDQSMHVQVGQQTHVLSALVTRCIWVTGVEAINRSTDAIS